MIRAFFAVELDEPARAAAMQVADFLAGEPRGDTVRWVRQAGLHVTLRFLGDVDEGRVPALVDAAAKAVAGAESFTLSLGDVVGLPNDRRPRVVALAISVVRGNPR